MAISRNTPIDFERIASEMRPIIDRWYNATVEVVDPNTGDLSWDIATNSYSGDAATSVWSGKARIQPVRTASLPDGEIYNPSIQSVRIQVPYDSTVDYIRPGMSVRVSDAGEIHYLADLEFTIRSAVNSSYGWNTTLECDVDLRSVSDG